MENASKALIIAGAILLSILIITIGLYVYSNAKSTIDNSLTSMSKSEKDAFNSTFESYEGAQTGSQLKALMGTLITNSNTYKEEPAKIISLGADELRSVGARNGSDVKQAVKPANANANEDYVANLGKMRNLVENKHTYWVELVYDGTGLIHTINISYEPSAKANEGRLLNATGTK